MTGTEARDLLDRIDQEGFDYTFIHYHDWKEIKDEEFHQLRRAYIAAYEALAEYVGHDA